VEPALAEGAVYRYFKLLGDDGRKVLPCGLYDWPPTDTELGVKMQ